MPPNVRDLQPPTIDGAELFDEIERRVARYVFIGEHERAVIVAFIAHCHTIDAFWTTPRIKITSPEEDCGKSLLALRITGPLLPVGSVLSVSITPAALYRKLQNSTVAFVLDEFDNSLGRKGAVDSETASTLLAVLNSGYQRGASVDRCVPPTYEPVAFSTFAPVVVSGIRPDLSKPFETRTIPIEMVKPLPGEYPQEFEYNQETAEAAEELQGRIVEWAEQTPVQVADGQDRRASSSQPGRKTGCAGSIPTWTGSPAVVSLRRRPRRCAAGASCGRNVSPTRPGRGFRRTGWVKRPGRADPRSTRW